MKRHKNAAEIWGIGASNPRAVARALVDAIDEACEGVGSAGAHDPAVQMILDHLAHLCGMPQPSLDMVDWNLAMDAVKAQAGDSAKFLP